MLQTLDAFLAFLAAILVLSLMVTAGTQFTQSVLRLRGRNFRAALEELIRTEVPGIAATDAPALARDVCNAPTLQRRRSAPPPRPDSVLGRLLAGTRARLGTTTSWLDESELTEALVGLHERHNSANGKSGIDGEAVRKRVADLAPRMERWRARRHAFHMRVISVVWALIVAFGFQVSAPDLFARARDDPAYRAEAARVASELAAAGVTDEASLRVALDRIEAPSPVAAALEPWPRGVEYFANEGPDALCERLRWDHIVEVLITAVLLTFGAPFWYDRLREIAGLRDRLRSNAPGEAKPDA